MTLYKLFITSPSHSPCCCHFLLVVYWYCSCCCRRRRCSVSFHLFFTLLFITIVVDIFVFVFAALFYFSSLCMNFSAANDDNTTIATHTQTVMHIHIARRDSDEYSNWTIRWKTLSLFSSSSFILVLSVAFFLWPLRILHTHSEWKIHKTL